MDLQTFAQGERRCYEVYSAFGPRDERELEVVWTILLVSHAFARGEALEPVTPG